MSKENVELVRRRFDAFNRGDLAAMIELTDRYEVGTSTTSGPVWDPPGDRARRPEDEKSPP
jgi:ketosteroid isomerase-like protein